MPVADGMAVMAVGISELGEPVTDGLVLAVSSDPLTVEDAEDSTAVVDGFTSSLVVETAKLSFPGVLDGARKELPLKKEETEGTPALVAVLPSSTDEGPAELGDVETKKTDEVAESVATWPGTNVTTVAESAVVVSLCPASLIHFGAKPLRCAEPLRGPASAAASMADNTRIAERIFALGVYMYAAVVALVVVFIKQGWEEQVVLPAENRY